ncbi:glycosyltransferase [Tatumella terrea]
MEYSVLMSLYVKESPHRLESCLRSLSLQTRMSDDIVIVIDGPITKELENILHKWKDLLPLKVYPLEKNVGLGNALNYGIQYCKNNIVARMDTDDVCLPCRFEKQISYLSDNSDIAILGSQINEINPETLERREKILPLKTDHIKIFSKIKNPFNHMTVVFNKDIIERAGGYKHHLYMEDYNLWLRVISKGFRVENMPDILVDASVDESTLAKRKGLQYIKSELQLFSLKRELGITTGLNSYYILFMRVITRVLPSCILKRLYVIDRSRGKNGK